jgi:hypothetical protein
VLCVLVKALDVEGRVSFSDSEKMRKIEGGHTPRECHLSCEYEFILRKIEDQRVSNFSHVSKEMFHSFLIYKRRWGSNRIVMKIKILKTGTKSSQMIKISYETWQQDEER